MVYKQTGIFSIFNKQSESLIPGL